MKRFQVLVAVALLAVAGTGLAVTCAQDNVPGATLLVPYFKVSRNGVTDFSNIGVGGTDTLVSVTNVSSTGLIAHVTVWNKYSKAVLDFNIPMTGYDVVGFYMKNILNGELNVNAQKVDLCLPANKAIGGFGATTYQRFTNPDARDGGDRFTTTALYSKPAFGGSFRQQVWTSLDESGDISSLSLSGGGNILDTTNYACDNTDAFTTLSGDFSGYLTIDVVNYCTNWFPADAQTYYMDAIATTGWDQALVNAPGTPNLLMGDIFYVDPAVNGGNISGDPAISLEFDSRLYAATEKTFYNRYFPGVLVDNGVPKDYQGNAGGYPAAYASIGDGREPLGLRYGFRYLWDGKMTNPEARTWAVIWRSDVYDLGTEKDLCSWWASGGGEKDSGGFTDGNTGVNISIWDNDETAVTTQTQNGPSGQPIVTAGKFIFLETQRVVVTPNTDFVPSSSGTGLWSNGGWIRTDFNVTNVSNYAQAWVGIQHSGSGLAVSVGHSATLLDNQFQCTPAGAVFSQAGNVVAKQ